MRNRRVIGFVYDMDSPRSFLQNSVFTFPSIRLNQEAIPIDADFLLVAESLHPASRK